MIPPGLWRLRSIEIAALRWGSAALYADERIVEPAKKLPPLIRPTSFFLPHEKPGT
jgi:hypothetical protein